MFYHQQIPIISAHQAVEFGTLVVQPASGLYHLVYDDVAGRYRPLLEAFRLGLGVLPAVELLTRA